MAHVVLRWAVEEQVEGDHQLKYLRIAPLDPSQPDLQGHSMTILPKDCDFLSLLCVFLSVSPGAPGFNTLLEVRS